MILASIKRRESQVLKDATNNKIEAMHEKLQSNWWYMSNCYFINYEKSYNEKYNVKSHQIKQITWFLHQIKEENHIFQKMSKMLKTIEFWWQMTAELNVYIDFLKYLNIMTKRMTSLHKRILCLLVVWFFCFALVLLMSKKSFQTRFCW